MSECFCILGFNVQECMLGCIEVLYLMFWEVTKPFFKFWIRLDPYQQWVRSFFWTTPLVLISYRHVDIDICFVVGYHTQLFQRLLLILYSVITPGGLWGLYVVLGIELGSEPCKANALIPVLEDTKLGFWRGRMVNWWQIRRLRLWCGWVW